MAIRIDNSPSGTVQLIAPSSGSSRFAFPSSNGSNGYVLSTDGSGNLSWTAAPPAADYVLKAGDTMTGNLNFSGTGLRIRANFSDSTVSNRFAFQTNVTNGATAITVYPNGTSKVAGFNVFGQQALSDAEGGGIVGQLLATETDVRITSNAFGAGTALPLVFHTAGVERMRIMPDGFVGIGTTDPKRSLHVNGGVALQDSRSIHWGTSDDVVNDVFNIRIAGTPSTGIIDFLTASPGVNASISRMMIDSTGRIMINHAGVIPTNNQTGLMFETGSNPGQIKAQGISGYNFAIFYNTTNSAVIGSITNNGGTGTTYATTSDYRLKTNVELISNSLTLLAQLKPSTFEFISNPGHRMMGFIAHELGEVIPQAVTGEKDQVDNDGNPVYQGVDMSRVVPLLTASVQQLSQQIQAQQQQIQQLMNEITWLYQRLGQ